MSPLLLSALLNNIALPELTRWLADLHANGRVVTEDEARAKLQADADAGNAAAAAFLASHPAA